MPALASGSQWVSYTLHSSELLGQPPLGESPEQLRGLFSYQTVLGLVCQLPHLPTLLGDVSVGNLVVLFSILLTYKLGPL